ncbi:hypothetical protein BK746_07670 [Bacillus thuringiensis serovar yosoo]|uniref:DDE domain-containing protein n=1 Tax=Bacillus thuringiensis serovar yosoo TaxID=180848 RepID=A0A9X6FDK3_BACTU|nr:hypothetical protein BK746_07670 [Bacillus thuringiensis serovar yosoo]
MNQSFRSFTQWCKTVRLCFKSPEAYIKVKGPCMYLYLAVDLKGNTSAFYLIKTRDRQAAKRYFKKC